MPGGYVSEPHGRLGPVHVLSASARCAEHVDAHVVGLHVDLHIFVHLWIVNTEANDVCRRALASNGEMRTRRCTPLSDCIRP